MKSIEILNDIDKSHGLKVLIGKGIMSWTMMWYRDIYNEYDVFIKLGNKKEESVNLVCDKFNTSRATVYKALKEMNNE